MKKASGKEGPRKYVNACINTSYWGSDLVNGYACKVTWKLKLTRQSYCLPYYHSIFSLLRALIALISHLFHNQRRVRQICLSVYSLFSWERSTLDLQFIKYVRARSFTHFVCVWHSVVVADPLVSEKENQCFKYIMHNPRKQKKRWNTWIGSIV